MPAFIELAERQPAYVPEVAAACAAIGDYDTALAYLRRACEMRSPILIYAYIYAYVEPALDWLMADPRAVGMLGEYGPPVGFTPRLPSPRS